MLWLKKSYVPYLFAFWKNSTNFCRLLIFFFKIKILKNFFQEYHQYQIVCIQISLIWVQTVFKGYQWRSQNAEKVTHNKGRLLDFITHMRNCVMGAMPMAINRGQKMLLVGMRKLKEQEIRT